MDFTDIGRGGDNWVVVLQDRDNWQTLLNTVTNIFYLPLIHKRIVLKRILKFTLKQLLHVSVQSPSTGSALFELAKVIVVKIIN